MIPVVIHADQIAQFIEYKVRCIAKPGREDFEIASVGIGPDNHALVRVFPFPAVWPHAVEADVADAPINPSVGALDQARHAMAAKANMYAVSMGDRFFEIGQRSEEHMSELQSLMRISYAVFCLNNKNKQKFK